MKITGKKNFETKEDNINRLKQYIISNGKTDEDDDGKQYYYCTFSGEEIIETIQKNDSFDFDISWPIDPSNKIRDSITSMSNSSIHMLLSSFNYIFLRHFGFSMNEIGFNSYV
ncbi:MAG: hypothetical protein VZQ83_09390 [Eubacterium sp.]|nr:hypothetical protein [Eubacterium sp.]